VSVLGLLIFHFAVTLCAARRFSLPRRRQARRRLRIGSGRTRTAQTARFAARLARKDPQTAETAYWVGVHLYESAFQEFVHCHFTDDIYYHNLWKKGVAPQCPGN
jgi:hypothetical protein